MATIKDAVGMAKDVAVLTIKNAREMTPQGRKAVANWLRDQAASLEKDGNEYASRFRARYLT